MIIEQVFTDYIGDVDWLLTERLFYSSNPHAQENLTPFITLIPIYSSRKAIVMVESIFVVKSPAYFEIDFHPEVWMSVRSHCGVLRVGVLSPHAFVCRVLSEDQDSLPRRANITHAAPRGIDPVPSGMRRCLASQNPNVACLSAAPRRVHCFISTSSTRTWWEGGRF